jgi:antitoxin YefM
MTILPLSEVKARLSEIADEVATTHERVQVTKNGREYVVLMAAEDLESMEATLELLADPEAQARLVKARADVERGDVVGEEELRSILAGLRSEPTSAG